MVPLKQLVQYDPIEQSAQSQAEQQGWQEREAHRVERSLFLV